MRRVVAVIMAVTAIGGGAATVGAAATPTATIAKACGHGYTHGVIGGEQKCLRRGSSALTDTATSTTGTASTACCSSRATHTT